MAINKSSGAECALISALALAGWCAPSGGAGEKIAGSALQSVLKMAVASRIEEETSAGGIA